jgi:hypothetical protein
MYVHQQQKSGHEIGIPEYVYTDHFLFDFFGLEVRRPAVENKTKRERYCCREQEK